MRPAAVLRQVAARLLRAALIYGQDEVLPQLPSVLHALRTAVGDDDAGEWLWREWHSGERGVEAPHRHPTCHLNTEEPLLHC